MKPTILLTTIALLLTAGGSLAQQAPTPRFGGPQPPREPFLKERGAPSTAPDNTGVLTTMTTVFELFTLPEEEANALLTAPPDAAARYRRVTDLLKLGKARLELVEATANRSGARTILESLDQAYVPQEYLRQEAADNSALGASMQSIGMGDRLEMEVNLAPDARTCNLNVTMENGQLLGLREFRITKERPSEQGAVMEKSLITTSLSIRTGEPILLGTMSRSPSLPDRLAETRLAFVRILVNQDRPTGAEPSIGALGYLEQTLWLYSVDRTTARELLSAEHKPGELYLAVQAMAKNQQARLEHMAFLPAQVGVKAMVSENVVVRAPGTVAPAENPSLAENPRPNGLVLKKEPWPRGSLLVSKLPGQNVGFSGDLGCEVGPPDALLKGLPLTAELYANIWWRADLGLMQQKGVPLENPQRPALEIRHLDSYLRCYTDVPTFIGTMNPPRATGVNDRKDDGRVWLCFVRVSPVRP